MKKEGSDDENEEREKKASKGKEEGEDLLN